MTITSKLYDTNGNDLINMEIVSGSLDVLGYFVNHLEPEAEGLYIKAGDVQINISCGYLGYFVSYAVDVSDGDVDTSFDLDSSEEAWDFIKDYLGNVIETERAVQAWD
jgi:hypothetical protein